MPPVFLGLFVFMLKRLKCLFATILFTICFTCIDPLVSANPETWTGTWSAPSLSQPSIQIIIRLLPDGTATEHIGDYRGAGTWKIEGDTAKISWSSNWVGLLTPAANGGFELLTWKANNKMNEAPDDQQPARRISPEPAN